MKRIEWSTPAREDLAEIDAYWWGMDPEFAERLLAKVEASAEMLCDVPRIGRTVEDDARKWSVRGTPYLLLYRDRPDRIEVLRVHHGSRNWSTEW